MQPNNLNSASEIRSADEGALTLTPSSCLQTKQGISVINAYIDVKEGIF